ncbi:MULTISPECIES: hypothetical protein [unclassified Pseudonocardia]|uniref:hypothetical protein n=1 Tax=unclassified Pseudonocardia TaxID=2619320 RepID=UPI000761BAE6|nr:MULTISPECIES: hypothetical protein [unclassified Pseudonocardia]
MTEESTPTQAVEADAVADAGTDGANADLADVPASVFPPASPVLSAATPSVGRGVELEACQFPGGCPHTVEYAGTGRRPKYCYQVVGGVMHDRGNAKRVADGGAPARRRGEPDDAAARPVTRAQQTVQTQVTGLATRLEEVSGELRDALGNLADPDAVAAEIAAARRGARAEIDTAQAARDEATAELSATRAELEATQLALDEARTEQARLQRDLDTTRTELASAVQDRDAAGAERDRLRGEVTDQARAVEEVQAERDAAQVAAEQLRTERDTARAETEAARRDVERLQTDRDHAMAERDTRADERDTARDHAAEARTQLAVAESSIAALRDQLARDLERERAYGQQRLDDAETRHHTQIRELRAEFAQLRTGQNSAATPQAGTDQPRSTGGRRPSPRTARRRTGPTAPPTSPDQPGDTSDDQE